MKTKLLPLTAALATIFWVDLSTAKRYCKINDDCTPLGELECIKSMCEWGVCGCPRGKAARYLGTSDRFRCVEVKKVNEKCSNDEDDGVCGAENSYCDEESHRCRCEKNYVPIWGGERCALPQRTTAGETCSASIGQCELNTVSKCTQTNTYIHPQVKFDVPTCACPNTYTLRLSRRDYYGSISDMPFIWGIEPECFKRRIGDICLYNSDCPANAECISNRCKCENSLVPSYSKTSCKKALVKGAACTLADVDTNQFHCDGSAGLKCGDHCFMEDDPNNGKCACGPHHRESGTGCVLRSVGDSCYGDYNCKGISFTAICEDEKCKDA